jgi:hypothetical protein
MYSSHNLPILLRTITAVKLRLGQVRNVGGVAGSKGGRHVWVVCWSWGSGTSEDEHEPQTQLFYRSARHIQNCWRLMYTIQVGSCAQTFHASHNSLQSLTCQTFHANFSRLALWHLHDATCMKRLHVHSRVWTRKKCIIFIFYLLLFDTLNAFLHPLFSFCCPFRNGG